MEQIVHRLFLFFYISLLINFSFLLAHKNISKLSPPLEKFFCVAQKMQLEKNYENALELYNHILSLCPHHADSFINAASILFSQKKYAAALDYYHSAEKIDKESIKECNEKLSFCYEKIAQWHIGNNDVCSALNCYKKALAYSPQNAHLLAKAGTCLAMHGKYKKALDLCKKAVKIDPHLYGALHNAGYCLQKLGLVEDAIRVFEYILKINPDYVLAHFSIALSHLTLGNFLEGFTEYEWRWKAFEEEPPYFDCLIWSGQDLHDKKILVHAEQGLGDTFQFMRYLKILKNLGAYVVFKVQNPLKNIVSLAPYIDKVIDYNQQSPKTDYAISLMSLPHILRTEISSIPMNIPYIYADQDLVELWKPIIKMDETFNIGICYQGSFHYLTQDEVTHRSLHLSYFEPLAYLPNVRLFSLQKREGEEQIKEITFPIHQFDAHFDNEHGRFMDTAAVIKNLDLVITIDTSIAHLAGGLGVPVWVILPKSADWRWMINRTDTPWYPTMQLFRQTTAHNWTTVISTIVSEITKICGKNTPENIEGKYKNNFYEY